MSVWIRRFMGDMGSCHRRLCRTASLWSNPLVLLLAGIRGVHDCVIVTEHVVLEYNNKSKDDLGGLAFSA
jgi:hypothetical protein